MNVGDKISVTIQGVHVVNAEVKEVADGTATLIVPATRVVMAVKTELAPEVTPQSEGTQHVVDEVVRAPENAGGEVVPDQIPATSSVETGQVTADKVITSTSVPAPNDAAVDPAKALSELPAEVQAQIAAVVNAHNEAQAKAASDQAQE